MKMNAKIIGLLAVVLSISSVVGVFATTGIFAPSKATTTVTTPTTPTQIPSCSFNVYKYDISASVANYTISGKISGNVPPVTNCYITVVMTSGSNSTTYSNVVVTNGTFQVKTSWMPPCGPQAFYIDVNGYRISTNRC